MINDRNKTAFRRIALIAFFLLTAAQPARSFETDQYSLPPESLIDVGPEISSWVYQNLKKAVAEAAPGTSEIELTSKLLHRLASCDIGVTVFNSSHVAGHCTSRFLEKTFRKRSTGVRRYVHIPSPSIYRWGTTPGALGWLYQDGFVDSDYFWRSFSGTINVYGNIIGLDKIGHFLKLGRDYYRVYTEALANGKSEQESEQLAIDTIGVWHEQHLYGKLASGIYSNADLSANFAGLMLYKRLFKGATIWNVRYEPLLRMQEDGRWELSAELDGLALLKPFLTPHLNEALNPNWFTGSKIEKLRAEITKRCDAWTSRFPERTADDYEELARTLRTWNGRDYGHQVQPGGAFTMGRLCYHSVTNLP
ncbi:MAG TPA: hypothetical protein VFV50_06260 [Bdellovibrionales bacterium]|nr:hypothetical protein [Bdellovibrionales bacterium]